MPAEAKQEGNFRTRKDNKQSCWQYDCAATLLFFFFFLLLLWESKPKFFLQLTMPIWKKAFAFSTPPSMNFLFYWSCLLYVFIIKEALYPTLRLLFISTLFLQFFVINFLLFLSLSFFSDHSKTRGFRVKVVVRAICKSPKNYLSILYVVPVLYRSKQAKE